MTYQPKGSMCANCTKALEDCSHLDFKAMPVIGKTQILRIHIVKCTEFQRPKDDQ